jgi:hypothetical protein
VSTTKDELQAQLFPDSDTDPANPLASNVPVAVEGRRAAGRPPGALNIATKQWQEYLLANFTSPLIGAARVMMMDPFALAKALGCEPLEAFDRIQKAREFVARYVHQELPKAVEIEGKGQVHLVIGTLGAGEALADLGGGLTLDGTLAAPQQDQRLSAPRAPELDEGKLDE